MQASVALFASFAAARSEAFLWLAVAACVIAFHIGLNAAMTLSVKNRGTQLD